MPLFHVQDSDRPLWVIADNFQQAHNKWAELMAKENDMDWRDVDPPHGIAHICDDKDLLT
jgi:hypothetical protein